MEGKLNRVNVAVKCAQYKVKLMVVFKVLRKVLGVTFLTSSRKMEGNHRPTQSGKSYHETQSNMMRYKMYKRMRCFSH